MFKEIWDRQETWPVCLILIRRLCLVYWKYELTLKWSTVSYCFVPGCWQINCWLWLSYFNAAHFYLSRLVVLFPSIVTFLLRFYCDLLYCDYFHGLLCIFSLCKSFKHLSELNELFINKLSIYKLCFALKFLCMLHLLIITIINN